MRARSLVILFAAQLGALLDGAAVFAREPEQPAEAAPPPLRAPAATAWACTRETLLDDKPCTIEGKTTPHAPSREQVRENRRQARVLVDEVCGALASAGTAGPPQPLLQPCVARAAVAVRRCGGDGSRRLLDDAGRFNPGHARCYGALSTWAQEMTALAEAAIACCDCAGASCGTSGPRQDEDAGATDQCLSRVAGGRLPDVPVACLEGTCAAACAESRMLLGGPTPPPPSRKP